MKRKKHQFHCAKCNSALEIYKKGKKHRVLVCPICGILATNPFSATGAASGALLGAELGTIVPGVGNVAGAVIGGAIGGFSGKKKEKDVKLDAVQTHHAHSNSLDKVKLALGGKKHG